MASGKHRAFIVAIQHYRQMGEGLNTELPGTHAQALAFRSWLRKDERVAAEDIFFCTDDPALEGRTADADRRSIVRELRRLKDAGKDTTPVLYFYFSGHGFCFVDGNGAPVTDVLLAADYVDRDTSADACLRLVEIQRWLKMCLGPGDHHYFIDACRNELGVQDIEPTTLGLKYDVSSRAKPTVFTLFSTTTGLLAGVGDTFPRTLLDGLEGRGRAKVWRGPSLVVHFESLRAYAEQRLKKSLDPRKEGSSEGLLKQFAAPPEQTCQVVVTDAEPGDTFDLLVKDSRGRDLDTLPVNGPAATYRAVPDDYFFVLRPGAGTGVLIEPSEPVPVDLYDDCRVVYERKPDDGLAPAGARFRSLPPEPTLATVRVLPPGAGKLVLRSLGRDASTHTVDTEQVLELAPGRYSLETLDHRNTLVHKEQVDVAPGDHVIDRASFKSSPLRDVLLAQFPHTRGTVDMSETLGATVDQGMDLWLAIIGASRIIGPRRFSKLGPLPLASFAQSQPGEAPLYLLAGFDDPAVDLRVAVSNDWRTEPESVVPHSSLTGLYELVRGGPPGHRYVTIQIAQRAPLTLGAYTMPNRGTLMTVTADDRGALRVQQFVLPLEPLAERLPFAGGFGLPELQELREPLRVVRRLVEVQRGFERSVDLRSILSSDELDALLYFKWFEPIVALLAAYELVRRGEHQALLPTVVDNLRTHFPGMTDTEALARLSGRAPRPVDAPPVVLDGYEALDLSLPNVDVPPHERLDFSGPWTMWRGATATAD